MRIHVAALAALLGCASLAGASASAHAQDEAMNRTPVDFSTVIQRVIAMPSDPALQARAREHGLNVLNVTWEDTARSAGSAWGPNISDLTLQVLEGEGSSRRSHLLPVIRYPNFTDRTGDIPIESFYVRTGNAREGEEARTLELRSVLSNLQDHLSTRVRGRVNLLAARDTHVLVSAQHVFLPIPSDGEATFTPVLFNYQSEVGNPAVLVIMATREGISTTIIENRPGERTRQGWGQQLFYNERGERAPFTAERLSTVAERIESGRARDSDAGALDPGADVLLFIQVPLVHRAPQRRFGAMGGAEPEGVLMQAAPTPRSAAGPPPASDVEVAVLGHGETEGPFIELNGLDIERDTRFPIRVTVQFYRATSNGVVDEDDLREVAAQIQRVYDEADYVGSLVVPRGPRDRPTDWIRTNPEADVPQPPWWFDRR